jgi:hypothetical protein
MTNLNPGSVINPHDSYSNETIQLGRGTRQFNLRGLAIVDPERPSRDIPIIIPSRQKGRKDVMYSLPIGAYVTRVAVLIPKHLNLASGTYEIGPTLGAAGNVQVVYAQTLQMTSFDYEVGWVIADNEDFGRKRVAAQTDTPTGSGVQTITDTPLASGALIAEAAILSDPTVANGDVLTTPWLPHFLTPGAVAQPSSWTGKKGAIVLDISGYYLDATPVNYETATAGCQYLLD